MPTTSTLLHITSGLLPSHNIVYFRGLGAVERTYLNLPKKAILDKFQEQIIPEELFRFSMILICSLTHIKQLYTFYIQML